MNYILSNWTELDKQLNFIKQRFQALEEVNKSFSLLNGLNSIKVQVADLREKTEKLSEKKWFD